MIKLMIISSLVLLISITSSKVLYKFGVPILLIFIGLGMIFGSDGIVGIYFSDYELTKEISSIALVIIMFYGGFGTNWSMAKPSALQSILMSTLGVIITATLTGLFSHIVLKITLLEGLLIGAVVASTDAASVFAILRSQKLNLNGYLSVYMSGIIIGNSSHLPYKKSLFQFFDCISWIMQIVLFFMLGLLSFPSKFINIIGISVSISIFMILVARPVATFITLHPFKYSIKEKLFISWVGLRGAASIVFAIYATTYGVNMTYDIFHIVFFVALFSVLIQGTLLPKFAKKLDLVDNNTLVLKTFNDYASDIDRQLIEVNITSDSKLVNKSIADADISEDILILMIKRRGKTIVPKGVTIIEDGDVLVVTGDNLEQISL